MIFLRVLFIFVLLFPSYNSIANDFKIVVWFNDNSKMDVSFSEFPLFEYADNNLNLKSKNTIISWPLSQLVKLTIEKETPIDTDIHEISPGNHNVNFDYYKVYDISGKMLSLQIQSLLELPKGAYIIKKRSITTKVIIK